MGAMGDADSTEGYSDQLRRAAAAARLLQRSQLDIAKQFDELEDLGGGAKWMRDKTLRTARMLEQIAAVHAAQAIAYDDMIAAGGPENSRAYVEYEATTRRNTALLPKDDLTDGQQEPS